MRDGGQDAEKNGPFFLMGSEIWFNYRVGKLVPAQHNGWINQEILKM